jgi:hypothetical protein
VEVVVRYARHVTSVVACGVNDGVLRYPEILPDGDPGVVNPENNAVAKWAGYQIDELAEWFAAGRDEWGRALGADLRGDNDASRSALIALFGNAVRYHSGDK